MSDGCSGRVQSRFAICCSPQQLAAQGCGAVDLGAVNVAGAAEHEVPLAPPVAAAAAPATRTAAALPAAPLALQDQTRDSGLQPWRVRSQHAGIRRAIRPNCAPKKTFTACSESPPAASRKNRACTRNGRRIRLGENTVRATAIAKIYRTRDSWVFDLLWRAIGCCHEACQLLVISAGSCTCCCCISIRLGTVVVRHIGDTHSGIFLDN